MKRKLLIAFGVVLGLVVIAIIALSAIVKTYLKSDQLKALITPQAEKYTGRKVSVERIDISLFKGIVVKNLVVREKAEERDFVSVGEFVLSYDLMPLLSKRLVIKKVELVSPYIYIKRYKDGSFNFSDMVEQAGRKKAPSGGAPSGLPVSLVTDRVLLSDARVEFIDEMRKIPDISAQTDANLRVSLEKQISAEGYLDLKKLDATLKGTSTSTSGRVDISKKLIKADITSVVDGNPIGLKASIADYGTAPVIDYSLTAQELDLEKLMALAGAGRPSEKKQKSPKAMGPDEKSVEGPFKVNASGTLSVKSARYQKYNITDLNLSSDATLNIRPSDKGVTGSLDIKQLSGSVNGINASASGRVSLLEESVTALLKSTLDIPATFNYHEYAAEQLRLEASPDLTYSFASDDVSGRIGIKELRAASLRAKDFVITAVDFAGSTDVTYALSTGKARASADIDRLKASYQGIVLSASGKASYDGTTATAALKEASVTAAEYKHGEYAIKGLDLSAATDLKVALKDMAATGTVDIKSLRVNVNGADVSATGRLTTDGKSVTAALKGLVAKAAAYSYKDYSIKDLDLSADTNLKVSLKADTLPTGSVDLKSLKANVNNIDINASGAVSSDGNTATAKLASATLKSPGFKYGGYTVKDLSFSGATDIKVRLSDNMPVGTADLKELKANVNGIDTTAAGKVSADGRKLIADLLLGIDKDFIKLAATALNYGTAPDIKFDVYSKRLDINRLMALSGEKKNEGVAEKGGAPSQGAPPKKQKEPKKIAAEGTIKVDSADYLDYSIKDLSVIMKYINDVMTIDPAGMRIAGGKSIVADGTFKGNLSFTYPRGKEDSVDVMRRTMSGKGSSKFTKLQMKDVKVAHAIATLTGVEELKSPTFNDSQLNYVVKDEKVNLEGYMNSERVKFTTTGFVGLNKAIDMEGQLNLDPLLSRRLIITQFVQEKDGSSTLPLRIKGTTDAPRVTLDMEKILKKEVDKGFKRLFEQIVPGTQEQQPPAQEQPPVQEQPKEPKPSPEEPIKELFKGIFGR